MTWEQKGSASAQADKPLPNKREKMQPPEKALPATQADATAIGPAS
jgi:hypothetical protein